MIAVHFVCSLSVLGKLTLQPQCILSSINRPLQIANHVSTRRMLIPLYAKLV